MKKCVIHFLIVLITLFLIPLNAEKVSVLEEINIPESIMFGSGNIYILEGTTIYMYDETAYTYKGKFGKEGEGPGEIKKALFGGPLIMNPHQGKVMISSSAKFSVFTKDGTFEKETKISPFDAYYPFEDRFFCFSPYTREEDKQYLAVYLADKDLKKAKAPMIVTDNQVGQNFKMFFPFTSFAPFPYKDKLYIAPDPVKFAIDVYDKEGKKIYTISKEYKRKKIPSEYRKKTINWFENDYYWKNLYQMFKDRITFRDYYPPIAAVWVDSDKLYVFTHEFDKQGNRECIVMTLKGKEIKRVYLPMRENYGMDFNFPYNIYKDYFYILMENLDEETWELHKIKL